MEVFAPAEGRPHGRTGVRKIATSDSRSIACGGYAAELILFGLNMLGDENRNPLTEKAFIDAAIDNATEDKLQFFGAENAPTDGVWSDEQDREYMEYARYRVRPRMMPYLEELAMLAAELDEHSLITRERVEELFKVPLRR